MKIVSVIIPTYKNRGGLINSIESVLSQDYDNIEIIVVDDNDPCTAERKITEELIKQYMSNPRFKYICHEKNRNGAAARNTGIRNSKGEYIAFLDDDDLFHEHKISKQVAYLERHTEHDAVYCHAQKKNKVASSAIIEGNGTKEILLLKSNFYTPTLMFRREALIRINGFDESFIRHQDYELLLRFFQRKYTIGCVPDVLVEIGTNAGENILSGVKLEQLKRYFFNQFNEYIVNENRNTPGFSNKVYAIHYANVFINHIKHINVKLAIITFKNYFFKSPTTFLSVIFKNLMIHIKGKA